MSKLLQQAFLSAASEAKITPSRLSDAQAEKVRARIENEFCHSHSSHGPIHDRLLSGEVYRDDDAWRLASRLLLGKETIFLFNSADDATMFSIPSDANYEELIANFEVFDGYWFVVNDVSLLCLTSENFLIGSGPIAGELKNMIALSE